MAPRPELQRWWDGFQDWLEQHPDPHDAAQRLGAQLQRMSGAERDRFLRQALEVLLCRLHAYGVALLLLQSVSERRCLTEIAVLLDPLPGRLADDQESHLADLIRVLAVSGAAPSLAVVERYLLERPIGPFWATVPWVLWPRRVELFARAWRRYLSDSDETEWTDELVLGPFLIEPRAIHAVRAALEPDLPRVWDALCRKLSLQARRAGWLSDGQRADVERTVR